MKRRQASDAKSLLDAGHGPKLSSISAWGTGAYCAGRIAKLGECSPKRLGLRKQV